MTVLLLVEGQSDQQALPVLARKLLSGVRFTPIVVGKGDLLSAQKVEVHISHAMARQRGIDKAVLCIDSECTPINETEARINSVAREVAQSLSGVSIRAVVVDHSLEGWLLGDRETLAQFLGIRERQLGNYNPENECRPANLMERIFRRAGRDFVKTAALPALAERVDALRIAERSPTFQAFRQALAGGLGQVTSGGHACEPLLSNPLLRQQPV